jgi:hypothetical protein
MLRSLKVAQRNVRELNFKVTGTGTAAINTGGSEGTLVDNGTGDYTITFEKGGLRAISAQVTCGTAALYAAVTALSATAIDVKTYNAAGSATDGIFYLTVKLADSIEA